MIFDCHVHLPSPSQKLNFEWQPFAPDLAASLRYLRRSGVERALASSTWGQTAATPAELSAANDEIVQIAAEQAPFIVPSCLINPNFGGDTLTELRRCRERHHIAWIGELCGYMGGYTFDTPAFNAAMRLAGELNMVVQIHNDDATDVERLCRAFPQVTIVLSHLGDGPEDVVARIALTLTCPNLYLDICGNGFERMGVRELAVTIAGAERVLFGSDFTINDPAGVIARIEKSYFDQDTRQKILGGNLERLLKDHGAKL